VEIEDETTEFIREEKRKELERKQLEREKLFKKTE